MSLEVNRKIQFSPPDISEAEIEEVVEALKSGWITTGPKTKELERLMAEYCNTNRLVALNSCTAAMELTLRLLGIGPGDEVITSAYTYTASASVIEHVGAKIILVDVSDNSVEMDYEQLEAAITENTKCIIPVDIAGKMVDYDKIFEIVERKKDLFRPVEGSLQEEFDRIIIMADAAHSFGATRNSKHSGEVADFTCFSFHAVKNLTTAEGGAVTWTKKLAHLDEEIYKQYMLLSLHGQNKDALAKTKLGSWEYDIKAPYFKCNLTDVHAAIGLAQLKRYAEMLDRRRTVVEKYNAYFKDAPVTFLNHYGEDYASSAHLYLLRINGVRESERNEIIEKMAQRGIATNVHYKPLPMHTAYKNLGFDIADFPRAFAYYENEITLPLHSLLSDEDVDYIAQHLLEVLEEYK